MDILGGWAKYARIANTLGSRPFATLIGASDRAQRMHMTGANGVPNGHDLALLRSTHPSGFIPSVHLAPS